MLLIGQRCPTTLYALFVQYVGGGTGWVVTLRDTTDGAKTWQRTRLSVSGSAKDPPAVTLAADLRSPTIYVAVGNRVFSSSNAGRSWRVIGQGLPQDGVIRSLAAGNGKLYAAFGDKGIYETSDGGRTWAQSWPASGTAPGLGAAIVAVDPARAETVYASAYYPGQADTGTHILRSTNGGRSWTVVG